MQTFNGTLPNYPGVTKLTIGVTGRDGKRAEMVFVAPNAQSPLVAQIPTPFELREDYEPDAAALAEMSAHFANAETPLGDEMFGGE